jgi:endogenous inhibitor of DNA gyrase (YacG/DUF329 family)
MKDRMNSQSRADRPQEVVNDANACPSARATEKCAVCLKAYRPRHIVNDVSRRRRFCSNRCRLLAWAVATLAKELKAGQADGLLDEIRKLKT